MKSIEEEQPICRKKGSELACRVSLAYAREKKWDAVERQETEEGNMKHGKD
jgi:hypothetical protein